MKILFINTLFICVLLLLNSCDNKPKFQPEMMDKMADVLSELHIAEYYSQGLGTDVPKFKKNNDSLALYYASILNHHGFTANQFDSTFRWLLKNPEIMDSVYILANEKLEALRTEYKTSIGNASDLENKIQQSSADNLITNSDTTAKNNLTPVQKNEP